MRRLTGRDKDWTGKSGLPDDFAYKIIRSVGNYGEIFERNVGKNSPLQLERGHNALWNAQQPGQIYAPPLR